MLSLHRFGVGKNRERFTITHKKISSQWEFVDNSNIGENLSNLAGYQFFFKEFFITITGGNLYLHNCDNGNIDFDLQVIFELVEIRTGKIVHRKKPLIILAAESKSSANSRDIDRSIMNKCLELEFQWQIIIFTRDAVRKNNSCSSPPDRVMLTNWKNLFINRESTADVIVKASDGVAIRVHKFVLTTQSPVFRTMFNTNMNEKKNSLVKIEDFTSKVLTELIKFMYCGEAETSADINAELLRAAKRYEITGLYEICENSIIENFDRVDIWPMLEISHTFNMQKLFEFVASIFYL